MPNQVDIAMPPWRTKVKKLQIERGIGASPGCFNCKYSSSCYASLSNSDRQGAIIKGDWTYVGCLYGEALVGRKKAKILFVSMDRTGMGNRYEDFEITQQVFRTAAYCRTNQHMGGVDVVLKHLLDETTSCKDRCQQFALTNSVRCRPCSKSATSKSTDQMVLNCEHHTKAIIDVLRPDIIIAQGKNKGKENPCKSLLRLFEPNCVAHHKGDFGAEIRQDKERLFLLTAHPAAYDPYKGIKWKNGDIPEELKQLCEHVRELYSECSS